MSVSVQQHNIKEKLFSHYDLDGRVAIVTGASGLIGSAICCGLAAFGVRIAAGFYKNRKKAEELAESIKAEGGDCIAVESNLSQSSGIEKLRDAALDAFKGLDIVVANAGLKTRGPAMMTNSEAINELINLNFVSAITLVRVCIRHMVRSNWGRIILVGSRAGIVGLPGQAAYAATKGALGPWAASVAGEVGSKGITINVVAPGAIHDPFEQIYSVDEQKLVCNRIGTGRLGEPEEVAAVVTFLCSKTAGYINGAIIPVDGGARF